MVEIQVKQKEETDWRKESPIIDVQRLNDKTVRDAQKVLNGFTSQKPVKEFLEKKGDSKFLSIIKDLSVENVQEVSLASGKNMDVYSLIVKIKGGQAQTITLTVDKNSETLTRSVRKGNEDVILEMLVYKKGEIDYQGPR